MTECDHAWKAIPGASDYENCPGGHVRSLPRDKNGRTYPGTYPEPMKLREDGDGYLVFNYTDDDGVRHTNASVARVTLMTHVGPCPPGMEACHGDGGRKDNRWPENIRWDDRIVNWQEALDTRMRNNPPKPKPARTCPACGKEHRDRGRRCHACVVELGVRGAQLVAGGMTPERAAEELDYPPIHLLTLAVKYGGLRFVLEDEINAALRTASHPPSRLRRVLSRREASRQNSDAQ